MVYWIDNSDWDKYMYHVRLFDFPYVYLRVNVRRSSSLRILFGTRNESQNVILMNVVVNEEVTLKQICWVSSHTATSLLLFVVNL